MSDMISAEKAQEMLEGTTPGPWELMLGSHGRNKICATYPCINGLSALFTIADVNVPGESERGYTDDAFNPGVAEANTYLIAAAPRLARTVIALHAQLANAKAAQAIVVERATDLAEEWEQETYDGDVVSVRQYITSALADTDGLALVQALRDRAEKAEADRDRFLDVSNHLLKQVQAQTPMDAPAPSKPEQSDRDRLAAANAALEWEIATGDDLLCHDHWTAAALGGAYHMCPDEDSPGVWLLQWALRPSDFCMIYGGKITRHGSPEDAQAAAQVDLEARIMSALAEVQSPNEGSPE